MADPRDARPDRPDRRADAAAADGDDATADPDDITADPDDSGRPSGGAARVLEQLGLGNLDERLGLWSLEKLNDKLNEKLGDRGNDKLNDALGERLSEGLTIEKLNEKLPDGMSLPTLAEIERRLTLTPLTGGLPSLSELERRLGRSSGSRRPSPGRGDDDDADDADDATALSAPASPRTPPLATLVTRRGVFEDDWRARVTRDRPWPVVLLHGTGHSKGVWAELGSELREDGWATFAPDYGYRATKPLRESIDELEAYVAQVLHATGGRKAILVGHSQGGLLSTLLSFNLPERTRHVVCLAAPNHGTELGGRASAILRVPGAEPLLQNLIRGYWGDSAVDQLTGSPVVQPMGARDVIAPGVTYTCIASRTDQLINPLESCFLDDGGAGLVDNILIQDVHPKAVVLHEDVATDRRVRPMVRDALLALAPAARQGRGF